MQQTLVPLFPTAENVALATDLYELTMAAGYFHAKRTEWACFELFVRDLPPERSYLVAAGLEQAVHYLRHVRFTDAAIRWLRSLPVLKHVRPQFFDYLGRFRFRGDLDAVPEGTIVFAGEPLLRVTAPLIEAQVAETYLLTTINFQTLVATKAARIVGAARGRAVVDFGSRRAHGPQAGLLAARASYIGGCAGTSNALAGQQLGIPVFGTQAHSWVMAFDDEQEAFEAYLDVFPEHTTLLLDSYDTVEAARKAAALGSRVSGVRLDSGDLAALSRRVRRILDDAGMRRTRILASGDLNEHVIASLHRRRAAIDAFGVGTELATSRDAPALGGVYKLVEQQVGGRWVPRLKLSAGKETYPGRKQVYRVADGHGRFRRDVIALASEEQRGSALLVPVMRRGRLVGPLPALSDARSRAAEEIRRLPARFRRLEAPAHYPVQYSRRLRALRERTLKEIGHGRAGEKP
ncbi:MAG TPA: nicotinate phosphoribosyltransferase [Planctomycetota bacterium]|nr:nicotinate phosphoribosyltransferase [Planctomycetota bacterium]HRR80284.1 nicotinate phosphoribosyltransferase [Planctomycetota bacterium]HRT95926.1 nicotinate phosphoribosyltransferase [Planctomycetota bacterium]